MQSLRIRLRLKSSSVSVIALALTFASASVARAQVMYTVQNLGLPAGATSTSGFGINASGQVAGRAIIAGFARAYRVNPGGAFGDPGTDLGNLGGSYAAAWAINASGQVVGEAGTSSGVRAYRTSSTGIIGDSGTNLGTLGGDLSLAFGINNLGQVTGYSRLVPGGTNRAFRTSPTGNLGDAGANLGLMINDSLAISEGQAINSLGQVTGRATSSSGFLHAFRTSPTGNLSDPGVDLGSLGGHSYGYAINDLGQVTGPSRISQDGPFHAFRTTPTGLVSDPGADLGTLPGFNTSWAYGINNAGTVVGSSWDESASGVRRAFVFDSQMRNLNDLIDPNSGWVLYVAYAINDRGWITGDGFFNGGTVRQGFVLIPVPEPTSFALASTALFGGWIARRRRKSQARPALQRLEDRTTPALVASFVADIDPGTADSYAEPEAVLNGKGLFQARHTNYGKELWASDGSQAGTVMVKDINPGPAHSTPLFLTEMNGVIYFQADDGVHGTELWRTDGTEMGTYLLADINPGFNNSRPVIVASGTDKFTVHNGLLYFRADDGVHGVELWRSDGSAAGTYMVADVNPGPGSSNPAWLTILGSTMYFAADDGVRGVELWKSNGTAGGTSLVKDILPGSATSNVRRLETINGKVVFTANDGVRGTELWRSDGTANGTVIVKDIVSGGASGLNGAFLLKLPTGTGDLVIFNALTGPSGAQELWKSDGTASGTARLKANFAHAVGNLGYYEAINGTLYFCGNDYALWKTNGTSSGTIKLTPSTTLPDNIFTAYGKIFFTGFSANDNKLWTTNGTLSGTYSILDFVPGPGGSGRAFLNIGSTVLFQGYESIHGSELWRLDQTAGRMNLAPNSVTSIDVSVDWSASISTQREYMSPPSQRQTRNDDRFSIDLRTPDLTPIQIVDEEPGRLMVRESRVKEEVDVVALYLPTKPEIAFHPIS